MNTDVTAAKYPLNRPFNKMWPYCLFAVSWLMMLACIIFAAQKNKRELRELTELRAATPPHPLPPILINADPLDVCPEVFGLSNIIAIGWQACPTRSRQLIITWNDGSELRMDLPTNKWIRNPPNRPTFTQ